MSAMGLEASISAAIRQLDEILETVAKIRATGTLSDESYKFFESGALLRGQLNGLKNLIATREIVFVAAQVYPNKPSPKSPDKFLYSGSEVSFSQGRFLLLQSYVSTAWALYDGLSKVCGILCCTDSLAKNQAKAVKLPEHFLREDKAVGSRLRDHLKGGYGWPIAISYAIRNWLVHDGFTHDGVELFKSEIMDSTPFALEDAAWAKILDKCKGEYKAESSQTRLRDFPKVHLDVLTGLQICNQEIDEAMSFLLLWSVGVIELQIKLLFLRDIK